MTLILRFFVIKHNLPPTKKTVSRRWQNHRQDKKTAKTINLVLVTFQITKIDCLFQTKHLGGCYTD